mmetsp:Transcript_6389/g.9576  ORF Transcript_6389/g.9576 Transcript_6389/m.9576 type:complete len:351 (-) Transcript_6389:56-1108(-)
MKLKNLLLIVLLAIISVPCKSFYSKQIKQTNLKAKKVNIRTIKLFDSSTDNIKVDSKIEFIGEDSADFKLEEQKLSSWVNFGLVLGTVLTALYYLWINNATGYGDDYIRSIEILCQGNSEKAVAVLLLIFAASHSGLASLRPIGEEIIGSRAWRVIFGVVSLPLALSCVVYFINHRYDGTILWDFKNVVGMHELCWISSFVSFLFLYPSTFNLLEVAAVNKPKLHIWETGIMRISRHPQFVGQFIWCFGHTLWIGSSFMLITSCLLMLHHLFAVWNGDRRLEEKYGEGFTSVKERTSVLPFQAIIEGRQQIPKDYWKEFARLPYIVIALATVGAYYGHPFMQAGSYLLHW